MSKPVDYAALIEKKCTRCHADVLLELANAPMEGPDQ